MEQVWDENLFTAEGRIMHERVHERDGESRGDVRIERGLPLRSLKLGLIGKADVVEFHRVLLSSMQQAAGFLREVPMALMIFSISVIVLSLD